MKMIMEDGKSYHEKSCTMFVLADKQAAEIVTWSQRIDTKDIYDNSLHEYGRESEPHVTILYGINDDKTEPIRQALLKAGWSVPIVIEFGPIDKFSLSDKPYDVLKIPVISADIHKLHELIKLCTDNTVSFPDYHPHLTLAYVKKGAGDKYFGMEPMKGKKLVFDRFLFRTREKESHSILLYMKGFRQFMEDGEGGPVTANVSGDSPSMSMPPDMNGKKLLKRQAKILS